MYIAMYILLLIYARAYVLVIQIFAVLLFRNYASASNKKDTLKKSIRLTSVGTGCVESNDLFIYN